MADNSVRLFKVLRDGKSCHGGDLAWSLPVRLPSGEWRPGEWQEIAGRLALCATGLHLTTQPIEWYLDGASVYLAEYDGEIDGDPARDTKVAVRRCRLVSESDWSDHQVYSEGSHVVRSGRCRAGGNATVEAGGNATVTSDIWHSNSAQVALSDLAAHVDRRNGKLVLRSAEAS